MDVSINTNGKECVGKDLGNEISINQWKVARRKRLGGRFGNEILINQRNDKKNKIVGKKRGEMTNGQEEKI